MRKNAIRAVVTTALLGLMCCAGALASAPSASPLREAGNGAARLVADAAPARLDAQILDNDKAVGGAESESESAPLLPRNRLCMLLSGIGALVLLTRRRGM